MEKSLEFYKSLSDDNRVRLEEITDRNNELEKEVQELRKQVLNLTMNICMDLTCTHRIRETIMRYGKNKDRLNETPNSSRGDANLLTNNEVLIVKDSDYTILRKKDADNKLQTYVIIPLTDFNKDEINIK